MSNILSHLRQIKFLIPINLIVAGILFGNAMLVMADNTTLAQKNNTLEDVLLLADSPVKPSQIRPYFKPFIGQTITPTTLEKLRVAIASAYDNAGWGLTSVSTPVMQSNVAVVRVESIVLSEIKTSLQDTQQSQVNFESSKVLPALKINQAINLKELDSQLRLAQMQPHRTWEVDFRQNDELKQEGTTKRESPSTQIGFVTQAGKSLARSMEQAGDPVAVTKKPNHSRPQNRLIANVLISENSPWYGRMIFDNAGQKATGRERLRVQVGYGDLLVPGRALDITMLGATDNPSNQYQLALRYQHPLPSIATFISAETWYARSNSGTQADFFDVSSNSQGQTLSARRLLARKGNLEPFIEISAESSTYDNVINFFGVNLGNKVGLTPISITAGGQYNSDLSRMYGQIRWRHNEGWGNNASHAEYEAARFGATPYWNTVDGFFEWRTALSESREGVIRFQGQYSPDALVSPAQFRVGGSQAMRGLQESELAGDYGTSLSAEHWWRLSNSHQLSAWVDVAETFRHKALLAEAENASALSSGLAWQWRMTKSIYSNIIAAKVLHADDLAVTTSGDYRVQYSLNWSF